MEHTPGSNFAVLSSVFLKYRASFALVNDREIAKMKRSDKKSAQKDAKFPAEGMNAWLPFPNRAGRRNVLAAPSSSSSSVSYILRSGVETDVKRDLEARSVLCSIPMNQRSLNERQK